MTVHFVEPPPELRVGGLDAAIRSMESALRRAGVIVRNGAASTAQPGEVVHFHGLWRRDQSRLSARLRERGVAMIVSPHGMLEPWAWHHKWWKKWPYFQFIERAHLARADALLATAAGEARRLREFLPRARIATLPLGFTGDAVPDYDNARAKLGWTRDETVLLFLSRLHVKKGLDLLLRALAQIPCPAELRLVIVGEGDARYVSELRQLAKPLTARVEWIGPVWGDARWAYFQGADLFCLPSHSENFGLAVLEALQVGTPALTTTTTPWAQAGSVGVLATEPTVKSVAAALTRFFGAAKATPSDRAVIAEWAREEYSWDALVAGYVALYSELAESRR
ncbi:MAG: glycosyltransferase [Chthoniobacteraceae bacterium]